MFLTFNEGEPQNLWAGEQLIDGKRQHENADCFEQLPGLTLLQRFPEEGLKVLESRVPQGMRIKLAPRVPIIWVRRTASFYGSQWWH